MDEGISPREVELSGLPRIELVSLYMNRYAGLDARERGAFEAEFARRGLPIPDLSTQTPAAPEPEPKAAKKGLDRGTFLSYVLLIYTLTGVVYCWVFLVSRLFHRDIGSDPRHRTFQTLISFAYVALEAAVLALVGAD